MRTALAPLGDTIGDSGGVGGGGGRRWEIIAKIKFLIQLKGSLSTTRASSCSPPTFASISAHAFSSLQGAWKSKKKILKNLAEESYSIATRIGEKMLDGLTQSQNLKAMIELKRKQLNLDMSERLSEAELCNKVLEKIQGS
ncbi:hypothetical protein LguiB_008368 [Lonicera macranthoides]